MEYDGIDDFMRSSSEEVPLTTHCNSPLKFASARAALLRPAIGQYFSPHNPARKEWEFIRSRHAIERVNGFDSSYHQNEIFTTLKAPPHQIDLHDLSMQGGVGEELWSLNFKIIHQVGPTGLPEQIPALSQADKRELQDRYILRCFLEEGVLASGGPNMKVGKYWTPTSHEGLWEASPPGFQLYAGKRLFVVISSRGVSLLSRDHLVVLSDLAAQRHILSLANKLDLLLGKTTFPEGFLAKFFQNGDMILQKGGNEAYKVIYMLEASCSSRLVGDIKLGSPSGKTYHEKVTEDGIEKATATDTLDLYVEREQMISSLENDPNLLSQCYGLYRLWGHPTVEPLYGASALRAITTNVRIASTKQALDIGNKFKEEFTSRYYAQKQAWPDLDVSQLSPTNVIRQAYENLAPVPTDHAMYRRGHWSLVRFKQCFPVDPKFELLEVLSDKALSLDTIELRRNLEAGLGPGSSIDRALILKWLKTEFVDPQTFLENIDRDGFPFYEKSVGLREKEREGKLDARLFGLMTFVKRMYIVLTEALIAEHIIPLFPEITMTDDELSLDKKRLSFTKKPIDRFQLFTSLDFSKWNSNMRKEETQDLFQSLDHLFGFTSVFQRTHEMFESSFMYLLNGSYTPSQDRGVFHPIPGSWYGHLGGIEGLRQKGWTVWTILLIMICAEGRTMKLKLMGQGDNQILQMMFPAGNSEQDCMEEYYRFIDTLQKTLAIIGPPLKMEETWTSTDLFIYGKYIIYKRVALESSYKRICRMFKMSNEDFPTMESAVSSMTANVSSALSCSASIGSEYYIYVTELTGLFQLFLSTPYLHQESPLNQLKRPGEIKIAGLPRQEVGPLLTDQIMNSAAFYKQLLLFPRCLGGLPVLTLPQLIIRGFPDDLSASVSFLRKAYPLSNPSMKRFIRRILSPPFNPKGSFTLLLENPTSINLRVPSSPGEARRSSILEFLKDGCEIRNSYFKEFLEIVDSDEEESLIDFLKTCEPCNPVVLSAMYDATACARARKVVGKLQKTRTLSKVAVQEGGVDLFKVIRDSEINHLRSVLYNMSRIEQGPVVWSPSKCSVDHAKELRSTSWGRSIVGVDCAPPLECMILEENSPESVCDTRWELDKGYISIQVPSRMLGEEMSDPLVLGPFTPYRGSATKQKIVGHGSSIASYSSPLLAKAMKLGALVGWAAEPDSHFCKVIDVILKSITDVPLQMLLPLDAEAGGSVHHRFEDDRIEKGGAVGVLPNYGTKLTFITNYLVAYSKGSKNVNLMFQPFMAFSSVLLGTYFRHSGRSFYSSFHLHISSSCCIQDVEERFIEGEPLPVRLPRRLGNPFMFIPKEKAIPPTLKIQVFESTIPATRDPLELTNRLIGGLAHRIFQILETPNWTKKVYSSTKPGIVINWAFRAPLLRTLELVSLELLAVFSNQCNHKTPQRYITMVSERVSRSGSGAWQGLSNLIHCPNFHHELTQPPYHNTLIGNPEMSDMLLSMNIKSTVVAILSTWATADQEDHPLQDVQVRLPPSCGVVTHPSILLLMRRWILGQIDRDPIHIRNAIVATINKVILERPSGYDSEVARELIQEGNDLIFPETMDSLCKKAPEIEGPRPELGVVDLPLAHINLGAFLRSHCIRPYVDWNCNVPSVQQRLYTDHAHKFAPSPTTGPYKGFSLMREARFGDPRKILCCGDGAGGFTLSALRSYPRAEVYYNTLITGSNAIQQAPPIPFLPSLAGFPQMEERLVKLDVTNDNVTDITSPDYPIMFSTKFSRELDLIVCDAESPDYLQGTKPVKLARSVANLGRHLNCSIIIFKAYAHSIEILASQISVFLASYSRVSLLRCTFSNSQNSEVYLKVEAPGPLSTIVQEETRVVGPCVCPYTVLLVWSLRFEYPPPKWEHVYADYSAAVYPFWQDSLFSRVCRDLPFVADEKDRRYPESCLRWAWSTCSVLRGRKSLKRSVLKTSWFSRAIIGRLALQFLVMYSMTGPLSWEQVLNQWDDFTLLWFKTRDNKWSLMLTCAPIPEEVLGESRAWKISTILAPQSKKHLNQLIGIQSQLELTVEGIQGYPEGWFDFRGVGFPESEPVRKFVFGRMKLITQSDDSDPE